MCDNIRSVLSERVGRAIQPRNIRTARVESVVIAEDRDKQLSLCCVRYGEHKEHLAGDGEPKAQEHSMLAFGVLVTWEVHSPPFIEIGSWT